MICWICWSISSVSRAKPARLRSPARPANALARMDFSSGRRSWHESKAPQNFIFRIPLDCRPTGFPSARLRELTPVTTRRIERNKNTYGQLYPSCRCAGGVGFPSEANNGVDNSRAGPSIIRDYGWLGLSRSELRRERGGGNRIGMDCAAGFAANLLGGYGIVVLLVESNPQTVRVPFRSMTSRCESWCQAPDLSFRT